MSEHSILSCYRSFATVIFTVTALLSIVPALSGVIETVDDEASNSILKTGGNDSSCSRDVLYSCAYPKEMQQLHLVSNKEELDILCPRIKEGLRCIDQYTRNCFNPQQRVQFNQLFSESSMVFQEICQEGSSYRREFLKHAACIKDVRNDYSKCAERYQARLHSLDPSSPLSQKQIVLHCCWLEEYLNCSKESVSKVCGPSTSNFASNFLDRMAAPLVKDHCQEYKSHMEICVAKKSAGSTLSVHYATTIMLTSVIAYLMSKFA